MTVLRVFYGGTFDPVHNGHLAIARAAATALDCAVALMPAADPPHRAPPGADALHRAAMVGLAVADQPGLRIDRRELSRSGRSYSIDTLRESRAAYGADAPLALLIGADSLLGLPTWKDWRHLFELAHFVVADRPGSPLDALSAGRSSIHPNAGDDTVADGDHAGLARALAGRWASTADALRGSPAGRVLLLRQPLSPESATDIRRLIAEDAAWQALVPVAVADYIERHGLYGVAGKGGPRPAGRARPL